MNPGKAPAATAREASIEAAKVLRLMLAFFGDGEVPVAQSVPVSELPEVPRRLLAHNGHMTEVLSRHHGAALAVKPYRIRREGEIYGRRLDLFAAGVDRPVMTGVMIFNLALVAADVRDEIVQARTPLGEILVRRRILRRVSPEAYLRFDEGDPLVTRFGLAPAQPAYGRLATIACEGRPAVDLLEIVRP